MLNCRNYTGFTLIELVVYMAIMGFIIIVAGRVFSDSTKMRVRSQSMLASSEEAGRVSALIKEDVSQMGAKSWKEVSNGVTNFKVAQTVYNDISQQTGGGGCAYQESWCGGKSRDEVTYNSNTRPTNVGACMFFSDYTKITTASGGGEIYINRSTSGTATCSGNTADCAKPSKADGGYYFYLKSGNTSGNSANWDGVVGGTKPNCQQSSGGGGDLSSYTLNREDSLAFRKVHYKDDGTCRAVLKIAWGVDDKKNLYRKCDQITDNDCTGSVNIKGTDECPDSLVMATDVATLKFEPSKSEKFEQIAAASNLTSLGEFEKNNSTSESKHKDFSLTNSNSLATGTSCWSYTYEAGKVYTIDFELPCDDSACKNGVNEPYNSMTMFQPGTDHLSVGLRSGGNPINGIPDFLFYPPQNNTASKIRHFEFSVPQATTACIGITAAFYSEAANGHLEIENFKVSRKTNTGSAPTSKADVKEFKLTLKINKKGETSEVVTVIPVPNNGVKPSGGT